jgi:hypothetical protein
MGSGGGYTGSGGGYMGSGGGYTGSGGGYMGGAGAGRMEGMRMDSGYMGSPGSPSAIRAEPFPGRIDGMRRDTYTRVVKQSVLS